MPADIKKLMQDKELIVSAIQFKGPCLPVNVARAANLSLLFASAYLSELYAEKRVKMSYMRVGSSPLYYLDGQEAQLENFIEHLNPKEKEAFSMLKDNKILEDEKLQPAIRVALREIKDFAMPVKVKIHDDSKLFWKYFQLPDADVKALLSEIFGEGKKKKEKKEKKEIKLDSSLQEKEAIKSKSEKKQGEKKRKTKAEDLTFTNKIKEYISSKGMEVVDTLFVKKKECALKISLETSLGKQEYYLVAKDKKKISEDDLAVAIHKAQLEKMPVLFMSSGSLDSESEEYIKTWRNLIKFERIKI